MVPLIRIVVAAFGALLVLGGFVAIGSGATSAGLWSIALGAVGLVVVALERTRYRSQAAERGGDDPGPGGGESVPPGPPFRATEERFIDPTSGRRMRVYVDPASGERRYSADV